MASCTISSAFEKIEGKFLDSFQESNSHIVCEMYTQARVKDFGVSLFLKHPLIHLKNVYSFLEDNV